MRRSRLVGEGGTKTDEILLDHLLGDVVVDVLVLLKELDGLGLAVGLARVETAVKRTNELHATLLSQELLNTREDGLVVGDEGKGVPDSADLAVLLLRKVVERVDLLEGGGGKTSGLLKHDALDKGHDLRRVKVLDVARRKALEISLDPAISQGDTALTEDLVVELGHVDRGHSTLVQPSVPVDLSELLLGHDGVKVIVEELDEALSGHGLELVLLVLRRLSIP